MGRGGLELEILYDKAERRIEISATVSESVASAFEKQKALPKEGSLVVLGEVAGPDPVLATTGRGSVRKIVSLLRADAVQAIKATVGRVAAFHP